VIINQTNMQQVNFYLKQRAFYSVTEQKLTAHATFMVGTKESLTMAAASPTCFPDSTGWTNRKPPVITGDANVCTEAKVCSKRFPN